MAAGNQATPATINNLLTALAVNLRNACGAVREQETYIAGLGTAGLQALGYSAADAASVLQFMNYMNAVAAVYYGTGTQASASNYDAALSAVWGGQ